MKRDGEGLPAYRTVYEALRKRIMEGDFPAGSRLPSKRTAAADFGVSVITVEHAYALLCDEGYAESRERSGFYAAYRRRDSFPVGGDQTVPLPRAPASSGGGASGE